MCAILLAALFAAQPGEPTVVVTFDALTLTDAERLNGKLVAATFTVGAPSYTWGEGKNLRTVTAPRSADGAERTVILKGNRLNDTDTGAKVTVVGTLRVILHPPATVGQMDLGAWTELRIEER